MSAAGLRSSVNSLTEQTEPASVELAKLVAKQSRILGERIPDLVQRVLR